MKRFFILFAIIIAALPVSAQAESDTVTIDGIVISKSDPAWPEYRWQVKRGAPRVKYWNRVAKCETGRDWQDTGTWAGGLGIFTAKRFAQQGSGTWERWGGEQFALRPNGATPLQQIVVANRIAMFGYRVTYRQWNGIHSRVVQKVQYKKYSGFNGWGCIKMHRNGKVEGRWYIDLNPTKYERARSQYWKNPVPYKTHEVVLDDLNIPKYAYVKYKNQPNRLR